MSATALDTTRVAPSARNVICVDFDLTLVEWSSLDAIPKPLPGAVEAVRELERRGYEVVVFTSRLSPTWWDAHTGGDAIDAEAFGWGQESVVRRALADMGLGHLRVTGEKVPALAYIDDRAVHFAGDWAATLRAIPGDGIVDQPEPVPNERRPVWELVIEDMAERDRVGRERYGTPLQPHNGRDALVDAYQEALDLVVYLRQAIEERIR